MMTRITIMMMMMMMMQMKKFRTQFCRLFVKRMIMRITIMIIKFRTQFFRLFVKRITGSNWATAKNVASWWRGGDHHDNY